MGIRSAVIGLAAAATVLAAQDAPHWSDATRRVVLENGLTVLMLERGDLPIVSVQALYRFGSRNERPGETGAAHFVEHMAFRSTEEIAKQDLTNQILRWGGRWNGYTSYDQTVYGSHTPSRYLDWLLYLERQRMRHVRFDPAEVERERTSVIAEERQYRNSPVYTLVEHQLRRTALVAHPYGSPIMGRLSDLEGVTPRELERFYRARYAPNNLVLSIVGRFDRAEALNLVEKHFGDDPADGVPTEIRTIEPPQQGPRRVVMRARAGSAHLHLLVHAPAASSPQFATLLALDGVLAGGKPPGAGPVRPGSRLHRALVETGMATAVTTEVELSQYPGVYSIGVDAARGDDLPSLEARLDAVLQDAMQTIDEADVKRAARQVSAGLAFAAASNRAVADLLTVYEQMGSFSLLASIPRDLQAVDAAAVRALARERLAPERRSFGLLVPEPATSPSPTSDEDDTAGGTRSSAAAPEVTQVRRSTRRPIPAPRLEVPELPTPIVRRLRNGLTVLAARVPGESAHVRIRIAAGSRFDPPGEAGTALLTARLVGAASPLRALEQDREVRLAQSAFEDDPFAIRNVVELTAMSLPDDLAAVMEAFVQAVASSRFEAGEVDRMRQSVGRELDSRQDDSRWRARRVVFDRLFAASGAYGRTVEGSEESRARITARSLSAFHRRHYRPERTIIAVAGPGDPAAAVDRIAGLLEAWRPAADTSEDVPGASEVPGLASSATRRLPSERVVHVPLEKEQASIAIGLPGLARTDEDFAAVAALNYLLGETGYAGRLGERLVDTGLVYAVYSSVLADRAAGPILITTDAVRAREAVSRILATLDEFAARGVTESELREAQGFLLGRLLFRYESAAAASSALADLGYFGDGASPQAFARRVLSLTTAEVSAAARRYYDSSRAVIAVAGRW